MSRHGKHLKPIVWIVFVDKLPAHVVKKTTTTSCINIIQHLPFPNHFCKIFTTIGNKNCGTLNLNPDYSFRGTLT
jgi:hypothetical protein